MPIIRSSRLYVCYYRLWCAVPWFLAVGGQLQDSRPCVRDEGCCLRNIPMVFRNVGNHSSNDTELRREEKPTRFHRMVYCTYNMLNMFRALLCPSSGVRDYRCVTTAYGVQCLGCWWSEVRCRTAGYASSMREVARLFGVQCFGCWLSEVRYREVGYASRMNDVTRLYESNYFRYVGRIACCSAPDLRQPATKHCTP